MAIYLAGGFKSRWQDKVKNRFPNADYLDPSLHNILNPDEYVKWDLDAIRRCTVVLAYLEASNPGGYALALEIGYALALRKLIVLVEEHPSDERYHRFSMVRHAVEHRFERLEEALSFMQGMSPLNAVSSKNATRK